MSIPGKDLLAQIENADDIHTLGIKLGAYFRNHVLPAIQTTASNAAVSPTSKIAPPAPPESISVNTSGEMMQIVVNHTAPIQKGIQYVTHIATNPQFQDPIIYDHGASRSPAHIVLPTKSLDGTVTHNYYIATVAQYQGSAPSAPTYYGGSTPKAVTLSGTTQMDILPGTGSGTAENGGQTLVGLGKSQVRLGEK